MTTLSKNNFCRVILLAYALYFHRVMDTSMMSITSETNKYENSSIISKQVTENCHIPT